METKIIKQDKKSLDIEIDNLTLVELLRTYLNKQGADIAVWRREHQSKNPVLHIEAEKPKKLLKDSIAVIQKELDKASTDFKKLK